MALLTLTKEPLLIWRRRSRVRILRVRGSTPLILQKVMTYPTYCHIPANADNKDNLRLGLHVVTASILGLTASLDEGGLGIPVLLCVGLGLLEDGGLLDFVGLPLITTYRLEQTLRAAEVASAFFALRTSRLFLFFRMCSGTGASLQCLGTKGHGHNRKFARESMIKQLTSCLPWGAVGDERSRDLWILRQPAI